MQKYVKYISKFVSDILPSVIATIIGAYIVNHYIITKPDTPPATAVVAKAVDDTAGKASKGELKPGVAPAETASAPEPDKGLADKSAPDKPVADKPAEKATARHHPTLRDRAVAKAAASPATTGSVASASPVEPAAQDARRDANELARAAIDRLRPPAAAPRPAETAPRPQEATRAPEPPQVVAPLQPLPPPVNVAMPAPVAVSTPSPVVTAATPPSVSPPYTYSANGRDGESRRPSPPAEIPPPHDIQAEIVAPSRPSVAEDVLLAAKSVFHAVLPR